MIVRVDWWSIVLTGEGTLVAIASFCPLVARESAFQATSLGDRFTLNEIDVNKNWGIV
jgi:hypothetical protein